VGGSVSYLAGGKFGNGAATGAFQMAVSLAQSAGEREDGFEENDYSDEVETNSMVKRRSTTITIDGVKVVDFGSYTVSADSSISTAVAQAYIDMAQRGWTQSFVDSDGTVLATSLRLRLVSTRSDFQLKPCTPSICTFGLGAADVGGTVAYVSSGQRFNTPIHEFGHMLGLQHQAPNTRSIMSSAIDRAVQLNDSKRLIQKYERKRR
jgi:hypothetical protein